MNNLNRIIGNNLVYLRKLFGYTQEEISQLLGISQPAYCKYESGDTTVGEKNLEKLAELYYVDEFDIMQEDQSQLTPAFVFAYRKQTGKADLEAISSFHKIV